MNEVEVLDVARDTKMTMLIVSAPILIIGLAVGLVISIFQTLTHVQEMTLTFIPKIVSIFGASTLFMPWMLCQLTDFTNRLMATIVSLG